VEGGRNDRLLVSTVGKTSQIALHDFYSAYKNYKEDFHYSHYE
jgi:hypothetical protein